MSIAEQMEALGQAARTAARSLALTSGEDKARALNAAADAIRARTEIILAANAKDMAAATHLSEAMRDRLMLNASRIAAMAHGVACFPAGSLPAEVSRAARGRLAA